jgi:hypothetical protein
MMRKLQIFLNLKYQETIGICLKGLLNWKKVLTTLLKIILGIIITVVAIFGFIGIIFGLGSVLIWIFGGTYNSDTVITIGILTILSSVLILTFVSGLSIWIRDNLKKTEEIYKEEQIIKNSK